MNRSGTPIVARPTCLSKEDLLQKYANVFNGLSRLLGKYRTYTDSTVTPVQYPLRKVPVPLQAPVKTKQEELEAKGVITKVRTPTQWTNSMVSVTTKEKMKLCKIQKT